MTLTTAKWTIEDYHQMIGVGILTHRRVELLNGAIVEMSPEGTPHAAYSQEAGDYLRVILGERAKVRAAKPITLFSTNSEPEPDLAIVAPHPIEVYLQHHPYPEDIFWLVEFANSSLNKDLEIKRQVYATAGIPEYWVLNLKTLKLICFRSPVDGTYESQITLATGSLTPLAFPDLPITVERLLGRFS